MRGLLFLGLLLLAGCAERIAAVPPEATTRAQVPDLPDVRYWVDNDPGLMARHGLASIERERRALDLSDPQAPLPPASFLAISGGGDDGAFGAGLLVGWSAHGTRPSFKIVTGISTGALTAPFAFLGPAYDGALKAVYTEITRDDVYRSRGLVAALFDDALSDTTPLRRLIERNVDQAMLSAIAAEHARGRVLLIATTDLDSRKPVVWNIGKIAASGNPGALQLVRDVLVASASIPGAFPPVMIDVELDGQRYQEMHVDGGTTAQVFLYPSAFNLRELAAELGIERERRLYIIRNAHLEADWQSVERRTLPILGRAVESLIQTQGVGDLYRIYLLSQRDEIAYHLAIIGPEFQVEQSGDFDPAYMRALFDYGYQLAKDGFAWLDAPPDT